MITRAAIVVVTLVIVPAALAKGGVVAELSRPLPRAAAPGTSFLVSWKLLHPAEDDRPFSALKVFIRLHSLADGPATTAFAYEEPLGSGRYFATATVPEGGIAGVQIGLLGSTEIFFTVRGTRAKPGGSFPAWDLAAIAASLVVALLYAGVIRSRGVTRTRERTRRARPGLAAPRRPA
jgi:hypothetical protein